MVAATVPEGTYLVRACAKRKRGGAYRCKLAKGRLTVTKAPTPADTRAASERLREAITAGRSDSHLEDLQRIGDTFGGNRASGLPGYQHSVQHVIDVLKDAGYNPKTQLFPFVLYTQNAACDVRADRRGQRADLRRGRGLRRRSTTRGSGNVEDGLIRPVDRRPGRRQREYVAAASRRTSPASPEGDVALLQRGDVRLRREGGERRRGRRDRRDHLQPGQHRRERGPQRPVRPHARQRRSASRSSSLSYAERRRHRDDAAGATVRHRHRHDERRRARRPT